MDFWKNPDELMLEEIQQVKRKQSKVRRALFARQDHMEKEIESIYEELREDIDRIERVLELRNK